MRRNLAIVAATVAASLGLGLAAWAQRPVFPPGTIPGRPTIPAPGQVQGPGARLVPPRDAITFRYNDDDGAGQLVVSGREPARAGESAPIRVALIQNGARLEGSGTRVRLEDRMPRRTVYAFAIQSPRAAYFFEAVVDSGITLGGSGTYHRLGSPERPYRFSITLGGK